MCRRGLLIESRLASIESINATDRKLKCSMYLTGVRAFVCPQSFTPLAHQSPYIHLELQSECVDVIDWTIRSYQTHLHFYFLSSITSGLSFVFFSIHQLLLDTVKMQLVLYNTCAIQNTFKNNIRCIMYKNVKDVCVRVRETILCVWYVYGNLSFLENVFETSI